MNFKQYKLDENINKALELLQYTSPTQVQQVVIPTLLEKKDVIVHSETGSGKTASFAIPLCQHVEWDNPMVQALVLTPTRELAIQVREDMFNIGRFKRLKVTTLYGADSFRKQEKELRQRTHIAVGTPGRVLDHIESGTLITNNIEYLVLDEADEMLKMGFIEQVEAIIKELPTSRLTILLSATMDDRIVDIAQKYMDNPSLVEIETEHATFERIQQEFYEVNEEYKNRSLKDLTIIENPDSCIIFCNTQAAVDDVERYLLKNNYSCKKIHGGLEQKERTLIMKEFKQGGFRYLVATDVAARGIDVDDISLVINYDLPFLSENYVHRIGRTARINKEGKAISFVDANSKDYLLAIEELLNEKFKFNQLPSFEDVARNRNKFEQKMRFIPKLKKDKGAKLSESILKIHINAGKKTKMRAGDIVGTLCDIKDITSEDIGVISITDVSTFVEILNGKGEYVLKQLQNKTIKGRIRKVSKEIGSKQKGYIQ